MTSNNISELLKMQLESRSRNVHTQRTRSGFISTHVVTTRKSIRGGHNGKPHICVRLQLVENNHCSIPVHFLSTYQSQRPRWSQQSFLRAPIFRFGLEARSNRNSNTNPFSTRCRLQTGYKMQTRYKMPTEIFKIFFRLIRDDMSSYNSPSVTQSLFRDHLSRLFALLWNIPYPFLDHNRSYYNFKPSYSLLSLRTSCFV